MNFITVTTVTDQTAVVVPRYSGQVIRIGATEVVTTAGEPARIRGTGDLELSEGYWDGLTIVDGAYSGPPFTGNTAGAAWDGAPDASTSTLSAFTTTLAGLIVQVLPTGVAPERGKFISGQGMTGADFEGVVRPTPYSLAHDSYGLSVKLIEIEDHL